jgi:hypothetical protein
VKPTVVNLSSKPTGCKQAAVVVAQGRGIGELDLVEPVPRVIDIRAHLWRVAHRAQFCITRRGGLWVLPPIDLIPESTDHVVRPILVVMLMASGLRLLGTSVEAVGGLLVATALAAIGIVLRRRRNTAVNTSVAGGDAPASVDAAAARRTEAVAFRPRSGP